MPALVHVVALGFCELIPAGLVLSAWVGRWWLPAWFLGVCLRGTNPPAGTPNCSCWALAGGLIYTHAWWCPMEINKTWAVHWLDNFMCVSTGGCHFMCSTYVPVALGLNQTRLLRATNPPAGTPDCICGALVG